MSAATERLTRRAAALLLDIEGTLGSKAFLSEVLYPYSREQLPAFLAAHAADPQVQQALTDTQRLAEAEGLDASDPVQVLLGWIAQDRKAPPLKKLQGLIWRGGFEQGAFQGHLYPDASAALRRWHAAGLPLAIYSSGSVPAQRLYFGHSVAGDLLPCFRAHFDTDVGPKIEAESYRRIAAALNLAPAQLLFLSDSVAELQAAQAAGVQVLHVLREDTPASPEFVGLADFSLLQIDPIQP